MKILLIISSSVGCYKALDLVREFQKQGPENHEKPPKIMTKPKLSTKKISRSCFLRIFR